MKVKCWESLGESANEVLTAVTIGAVMKELLDDDVLGDEVVWDEITWCICRDEPISFNCGCRVKAFADANAINVALGIISVLKARGGGGERRPRCTAHTEMLRRLLGGDG